MLNTIANSDKGFSDMIYPLMLPNMVILHLKASLILFHVL